MKMGYSDMDPLIFRGQINKINAIFFFYCKRMVNTEIVIVITAHGKNKLLFKNILKNMSFLVCGDIW